MFDFTIYSKKHRLIATNWKDLRVYLVWEVHQPYGEIMTEELGFLDINDELEDEIELRQVPDEITNFILDNREKIINEVVY